MGAGIAPLRAALHGRQSGLRPCTLEGMPEDIWIGRVPGLEQVAIPAALAGFACRNNRLAELALGTDGFAAAVLAARDRHGADRIAVVLGTSTAGIAETEQAWRRRDPETARCRRISTMPAPRTCRRCRAMSAPGLACAARRSRSPPPAPPAPGR